MPVLKPPPPLLYRGLSPAWPADLGLAAHRAPSQLHKLLIRTSSNLILPKGVFRGVSIDSQTHR
jgi:hypothetical protein